MAKNTGEEFRKGSVDNRSQVLDPRNGKWTKRNDDTGKFMDQKSNGHPFKGVAHEPDGRKHR